MGFDAVGFADARTDPALARALTAFLAQGRHGSMGWMAERQDQRAAPRALWPETRSVIMLGCNYAPPTDPLALAAHPERGRISVYAQGRDYHDVIKARLKALGRWMVERWACGVKVFVDTAPVMEKPLAVRAGLGWRGRHTNLVSRRFGSWMFLGAIYTTLELAADPAEPDHCGSCRACVTACPTGALDGDGRIDARACVSYLTIEHKGPIAPALRPAIGNRIYGCDDCVAVCPWDKFAPPGRMAEFWPRIELTAPRLADLAQLDDAGFREVFSGSPIKRIGRDRLVRNVMIAIGNSGRPELAATAHAATGDADPVVAEAAAWALSRLS